MNTKELSDKILALAELTPDEQDASPDLELVSTELTDIANEASVALMKTPDGGMTVRDDPRMVVMMSVAHQEMGFMINLIGAQSIYKIVCATIGAYMRDGILIVPPTTNPDAEDGREINPDGTSNINS